MEREEEGEDEEEEEEEQKEEEEGEEAWPLCNGPMQDCSVYVRTEAAAPPAVPATWCGAPGTSAMAFSLAILPVRSLVSSGAGFETRSPSLAS